MKQVAAQLGVSTATVSNAYNRPDQLSEKLRERILRESAELGYYGPNLAARSLRRGESGVIGVMLADSISYSFSDPVANQLMQGIAEVLVENKKQLLLLSSGMTSAEQSSAESLPDGFILYGALQGNGFEHIKRTGKPVVVVDFEFADSGSVNIDNEQGAYNIAEHALQKEDNSQVAVLGLRLIDSSRICRLSQEDLSMPSQEISRLRLAGYMRAAEANKVSIPVDKIWHIPINSPEKAEVAAREALTSSPLPTVLLCMSDVIALAALRVANELNIAVPGQVQVTGFDDIPEASRSTPPLSTVCQQNLEKGRLAATMLLEGNSKEKVILETRLVVRQTCK
ncbi:MAG: LacI family DNA-binding transcriptional regulator [Paraglaciecola sp.]|uniref:LacI family DNA-binding transcriptional regulator n=1 Tax=Pseudomonadati TaxID=3379134 RepID=UPI00273EAFF3|nr:LacI family DNA-binding transcriptional regulator [Paraglaciecola sp.]MDP5032947.1 LacI family DNA-binding transcriptional regulator [Paraglaciecola sp.]MDP5039850.1 LacI family DNA-binding transcriptional regulator [Paraglaciecola sp.]MDP5133684.1 LacI family DNA-binding transcriptional regulator [Paraglaciecola sp.]